MELLMEEEENRTDMDNGDSFSTDNNMNVKKGKKSKDRGNYYDSCMLNFVWISNCSNEYQVFTNFLQMYMYVIRSCE